jgi:hypothetical protein
MYLDDIIMKDSSSVESERMSDKLTLEISLHD